MGRISSDMTEDEEREFIESRRRFQYLAASTWPVSWLFTAERHKRAADVLYEVAFAASERDWERLRSRVPHSGPMTEEQLRDTLDEQLLLDYLLLAGHALENCFKGILVCRNPQLVEGGSLDKYVRGHRVRDLADKCAIPLSQDEREVLHLMEHQIEWGKYPAPIEMKNMPSFADPDEKQLTCHNAFVNRRFRVIVDAVFGRAAAALAALRQPN